MLCLVVGVFCFEMWSRSGFLEGGGDYMPQDDKIIFLFWRK